MTSLTKLKMSNNNPSTTNLIPRIVQQQQQNNNNTTTYRPTNPELLSSPSHIQTSALSLHSFLQHKKNVLVLTGAGLSTESGIPDYRGYNGSYQHGHVPMVHDQFMNHEKQRQRYWGRSLVGWKSFASSKPSSGHEALTELERMGKIGVTFEDSPNYYSNDDDDDYLFSNGLQKLSIITQNVDGLHHKANSRYVTELHGRGNVLKCMTCGSFHCRREYHDLLTKLNQGWINDALKDVKEDDSSSSKLRPDGDAYIANDNYGDIIVPPCPTCLEKTNNDDDDDTTTTATTTTTPGFLKPDVVFFGDSVPRHRVERCYGAVKASDGLLCIGSSLAVHSAFRFVRAAAEENIPICILNVGKTRAEEGMIQQQQQEGNRRRRSRHDEELYEKLEKLVIKIEAPAGPTLSACVQMLKSSFSSSSSSSSSSNGDLYDNA